MCKSENAYHSNSLCPTPHTNRCNDMRSVRYVHLLKLLVCFDEHSDVAFDYPLICVSNLKSNHIKQTKPCSNYQVK